jgi:hypothetical protein
MAKYSAKGGLDFTPVPSGAHIAICTLVADVGMQPSQFYEPKRKVIFRFELPNERLDYTDKEGNVKNAPMVIYDTLTASMNKKATLRAMLTGWRGKEFTDEEAEEFDTKNVLGKACMISVVHKTSDGKTYANIASVMPLPKGTTAPKAETDLIYYDDTTPSIRDQLPEWIMKKVDGQLAPPKVIGREAVDDAMAAEVAGRDDFEDETIPF